uniref:BHLH domain-containing protein n=1 Tax=Haemonchus placei TaxID=6290 RepID=A0A0N4X1P9_HAEPC
MDEVHLLGILKLATWHGFLGTQRNKGGHSRNFTADGIDCNIQLIEPGRRPTVESLTQIVNRLAMSIEEIRAKVSHIHDDIHMLKSASLQRHPVHSALMRTWAGTNPPTATITLNRSFVTYEPSICTYAEDACVLSTGEVAMSSALLAVANTTSSYAARANHKSNDVCNHLWLLLYSTPYSTHYTRPSSSLPPADIRLLTFDLRASIDIFISAAVPLSSTFNLSGTNPYCTSSYSLPLRNGMASSAGGVAVIDGFNGTFDRALCSAPKSTGRYV